MVSPPPTKRFVAYAFCVGDVFVELDEGGRIASIDGATGWLGLTDGRDWKGHLFADVLHPGDRPVFETSLTAIRSAKRLGPISLRLKNGKWNEEQAVLAFLSRIEHNGPTHLVLASSGRFLDWARSVAQVTPPNREEFISGLAERLEAARKSGDVQLMLTLLQVADNKENPEFLRQLAALSLGGESVGHLGEGRYALLHEGDRKTSADLLTELREGSRVSFKSASVQLDTHSLAAPDRMRAFIYTIRRFADSRQHFDLDKLNENQMAVFAEAEARIGEFREILSKKRFDLAFQPIVALSDRHLHHVEALARFDLEHGSPFEMIRFAEDAGLIPEFDLATTGRVIRKLKSFNKTGNGASVAVNLSALSLADRTFMSDLMELLEREQEMREYLIFEVTESARIDDIAVIGEAIAQLREARYPVCLDDFGAGMSGYQYLRHLPVDYVKIDGAYVRDALTDTQSMAFLRSMVSLCGELGIETIAEWVETEEQAEMLGALGVGYGQGWLFGRPRARIPTRK